MMEGFEEDWNYVGNERKATYTNLSPGSYVFKVKASNNDGIWNDKGRSIKIIITPPFWQTIWFRTILLVSVLVIIYIIYKIRTYKINKRNRELADINLKLNKEIEKKHRAEQAIQQLNRELEKRVRERTAELQNVNQELESFSYSVSHDLRAPLRSMHGFSNAILEDYGDLLDEQGKNYLARIATASNTMADLIDDLLKLAKVSRSNIKKENINLSKIVEDMVSQLRINFPDRDVQVQIEENLYAKGDLNLIKVAIENLLNNAWKFTSKRSAAKIEFQKIEKKFGNVFMIKDNGVGFDMEYVDKLFEPFQRLHKEYEGTGIGLATVARIIKKHGGEFWAEGKVNEGARFYFTL
jgi:signal transduction histidine kinase